MGFMFEVHCPIFIMPCTLVTLTIHILARKYVPYILVSITYQEKKLLYSLSSTLLILY